MSVDGMDKYAALYDRFKTEIDSRLAETVAQEKPVSIFEPARYILESGGKRIRPVLLLSSCLAAGGNAEHAYDAATAVEILHNFTLVHDDIMDKAPTRRGLKTVHEQWDANVAILLGDELMGLAYRQLLRTTSGELSEILKCFTDGVIEVCEGQALDKEFESAGAVSMEQYWEMIQKKTGRLMVMSADIGAMIAEARDEHRRSILEYATHIGLAFQILDDLLDTVADDSFGKVIGRDIQEGKKTFLLVDAMEHARGEALDWLRNVGLRRVSGNDVIKKTTVLFHELGSIDRAREQVAMRTEKSLAAIQYLPDGEGKGMLEWFARMLLHRST